MPSPVSVPKLQELLTRATSDFSLCLTLIKKLDEGRLWGFRGLAPDLPSLPLMLP